VRIFLAGATGVIGSRLVPLLTGAGHAVAAMTRSPDQAGRLAGLGAEPVVCDVYDAAALGRAVTGFGPDLVMHQLTDLPDDTAQMAAYAGRNDRMRSEGTRNLLAAAAAAGAGRFVAQSISWELPAGRGSVTAEHERLVIDAGGVVIRYGQLYGPGTFYEGQPPEPPRIHVDDAARLTLPALDAPPGVTLVADDRARPRDARPLDARHRDAAR
jgi:nucleoside-diphosphate-sugar epimerase